MPANPPSVIDFRGIIDPNFDNTYNLNFPDGDKPSGGTPTWLKDLSFDGLTNGQSILPLVSFYGTFGNGYGCQGDTAIARSGKTSSMNMSIESGTTGFPGDGAPAGNGHFGFGHTFADESVTIGEGEDLWVGFWVWVPLGFNFNTSSTLKMIRFSQSGTGSKIEYQISDGDFFGGVSSDQEGWNNYVEAFPQLESETNRRCEDILVRGQWNFICIHTKFSNNQADSIQRLWCNDKFACEHVGGATTVTTRWIDENGAEQTDTWTPSAGSGNKYATLAAPGATVLSLFFFTFWNGNSPQDQSLNVQNLVYIKDDTDLSTDSDGNKYINSMQVA